jgi:hypothetical protein
MSFLADESAMPEALRLGYATAFTAASSVQAGLPHEPIKSTWRRASPSARSPGSEPALDINHRRRSSAWPGVCSLGLYMQSRRCQSRALTRKGYLRTTEDRDFVEKELC